MIIKAMRFMTLFLTLTIAPTWAKTSVNLIGHEITLPFPSEWLAKGSEKKNSFVFFNPKAAPPRIMISIYASSFKHPRNNLSEFEEVLRVKKAQWLKKMNATAPKSPEIINLKEQQSILLKFTFESTHGNFEEWTHFEECRNKQGIVLKALIPTTQVKDFMKYEETFKKGLCQG